MTGSAKWSLITLAGPLANGGELLEDAGRDLQEGCQGVTLWRLSQVVPTGGALSVRTDLPVNYSSPCERGTCKRS